MTSLNTSPSASPPLDRKTYGDFSTLDSLGLASLPQPLARSALHADLLALKLPPLPQGLSQNSRLHWARRAELTKRARNAARLIGLSARESAVTAGSAQWARPCSKVRIHIILFKQHRRIEDPGNVIGKCKATIDGLEDAGLIINDRGVQYGDVIIERRHQPATVLIIEPITHATDAEILKRMESRVPTEPGWLRSLASTIRRKAK